jgi:hypothetical protein
MTLMMQTFEKRAAKCSGCEIVELGDEPVGGFLRWNGDLRASAPKLAKSQVLLLHKWRVGVNTMIGRGLTFC